MTQQHLIELVASLCEDSNLSYDKTPPIEVSPGIWRFLAIEKSGECLKYGRCRQVSHFAMINGDTMKMC